MDREPRRRGRSRAASGMCLSQRFSVLSVHSVLEIFSRAELAYFSNTQIVRKVRLSQAEAQFAAGPFSGETASNGAGPYRGTRQAR